MALPVDIRIQAGSQMPASGFDAFERDEDMVPWRRPPRPGPYGNGQDFQRPLLDVVIQILGANDGEPKYARDIRDSANYWTDGAVVHDQHEMIQALTLMEKGGWIRQCGSVWRWELSVAGRKAYEKWWAGHLAKRGLCEVRDDDGRRKYKRLLVAPERKAA